ncbi:MAG: hypothetical protein QHH80_02085 [Anaerolineae bacterium]|jgi:outer membrane biosynthesis protein TonB|nr:hypothetical protein [Anaerolineae bacterium]
MLTMNWKRLVLVGLLVVAWLVAAGLAADESPAGSALALGFTSTPTFTPEGPTETPVPPTPTATPVPPTATPVPTIAPQPTQPPPAPTQPPSPQPTATPVAAPATSVPKTGAGLLGVALAGVLVLLLFGARRVRTSSR